MTNVTSIGQLLSLPPVTADSARALMLRVGEQMTATILDMAGNQALIDTNKGSRLLATVQADESLQAGQTVLLEVVDSTPEQLTLRLATPSTGAGEPLDPARVLRSIGLSDTPANEQAVDALMAEGQAVTKQSVQELRTTMQALQLSQPEDFRAVAFLMARGLPVTLALVNVVRQGLSGSSLLALADDLRQEASSLLERLPDTGNDDQEVAQLRTALENVTASSQGDLREPGSLGQAITDLATSLESVLAQVAVDEQLGSSEPAAADSEDQAGTSPATTDGAPAQAGNGGANGLPSSLPVGDGTESLLPRVDANVASSSPAQAAQSGVPSGDPSLDTTAKNDLLEQAGDSSLDAQNDKRGVISSLPSDFAQGKLAQGTAAPDTHLAVRQLLPVLARVIESGSLPDNLKATVLLLRDRAEQLVGATQFQQIKNGLPASSGGPDYLSFPLALWAGHQASQGELRLSIHDQTGSRRIDPEDVRIVMNLHLTRLQRLTISLHVLGRNMMCHIDSQNPSVDRVVRSAVAELREQLQQLGYNVAPITCSNLQQAPARAQPVETPKLSRVNLKV